MHESHEHGDADDRDDRGQHRQPTPVTSRLVGHTHDLIFPAGRDALLGEGPSAHRANPSPAPDPGDISVTACPAACGRRAGSARSRRARRPRARRSRSVRRGCPTPSATGRGRPTGPSRLPPPRWATASRSVRRPDRSRLRSGITLPPRASGAPAPVRSRITSCSFVTSTIAVPGAVPIPAASRGSISNQARSGVRNRTASRPSTSVRRMSCSALHLTVGQGVPDPRIRREPIGVLGVLRKDLERLVGVELPQESRRRARSRRADPA